MTKRNRETWTMRGIRRDVGKKVETHHEGRVNGWTTVPDGYELADVELSIDLEEVARRLGVKAMKNKSGRASMMWGLVSVKVTKRQRVGASNG